MSRRHSFLVLPFCSAQLCPVASSRLSRQHRRRRLPWGAVLGDRRSPASEKAHGKIQSEIVLGKKISPASPQLFPRNLNPLTSFSPPLPPPLSLPKRSSGSPVLESFASTSYAPGPFARHVVSRGRKRCRGLGLLLASGGSCSRCSRCSPRCSLPGCSRGSGSSGRVGGRGRGCAQEEEASGRISRGSVRPLWVVS